MTLASLVKYLIGLINTSVLPVLGFLAFAVFMYGALRFVFDTQASGKMGNYKDLLIWGLVALFVIFSIFGILSVAKQALLP